MLDQLKMAAKNGSAHLYFFDESGMSTVSILANKKMKNEKSLMRRIRVSLREYLQKKGMSVDWLTEDGGARISGTPRNPYFEPFSASLRFNKNNRIPVFEAISDCRLIFLRAMLHDVRPVRISAAKFFTAPFASIFLLFMIFIAKITRQWTEIQGRSAIALSISDNNQASISEFPFDMPMIFYGASIPPGAFFVQDSYGKNWKLDTFILTNVNFIEVENVI